MFEWINQNWELFCVCFGILVNAAGVIYNVCKFCRAGKGKTARDQIALMQAARTFEQEAEGFAQYSSAEKLQYVLSRLRVFTAERGCPYDEARLIAQIEEDIAFSKQVNADKSAYLD